MPVSIERIKVNSYCDYLERHIKNINSSWNIIKDRLKNINVISDDFLYFYIEDQIKEHDLSKFSQEEFIPYVEWFFSPYGKKYDVWDDGGEGTLIHKKIKDNFIIASTHHIENNYHHWENWSNNKEYFPNQTSCDIITMVADWMAMGIEFNDTAEQYYLNNRLEFNFEKWVDDFLLRVVFPKLR